MADEELKEEEKELYMESARDRDLDNDGIPDIWYSAKSRGLVFKNRATKEIYEQYISYDNSGRRPVLSVGAVLVDLVQELRKIRRILQEEPKKS